MCFFLKIQQVHKDWNMLNIRIEFLIDTTFRVKSRDISNDVVSDKIYSQITVIRTSIIVGIPLEDFFHIPF